MDGKYGILVDYDWCTGCHSCEMACQMEHGFPIGQSGVQVCTMGPWLIEGETWQYDFAPIFGDQCDLCADRTAKGELPTCVHHCQANCMTYGTLDELSALLADHRKQTLCAL